MILYVGTIDPVIFLVVSDESDEYISHYEFYHNNQSVSVPSYVENIMLVAY